MSFRTSLPARPSPDGLYIAAVTDSHLVIRLSRATVDEIPIRTISFSTDFASRATCIRWALDREISLDKSKPTQHRLLLADDHTIRVWDVVDTQWSTTINNAGGTFGKIAQVEFGLDANEVIVISEFGVKITLWDLHTGKCSEIKDPKFSHSRSFSYRPRTGHLALLTRPNAFDTLTIHAPRSHEAVTSFILPTMDTQGLKWSPNGHWIAAWDSAAAGYNIAIYTADGKLYRSCTGDDEDGMPGLGVKDIEWSPASNCLAISSFDNRVTLLSAKTFSPSIVFDHTSTINVPTLPVWQEQVSNSNEHSYAHCPQPAYPPTTPSLPSEPNPKAGTSKLTFNSSSTMLATRNDSMPTSVWIWSAQSLKPVAIIIQHAQVKSLSWHPSDPNLLLITCLEKPIAYQWSLSWEAPILATIPLENLGTKSSIEWLVTDESDHPLIFASSATSYIVGFLESIGEGHNCHFVNIAAAKHDDASPMKGLRSPRKDVTELFDESVIFDPEQEFGNFSGSVEDMDDTFHYRRHVPVLG